MMIVGIDYAVIHFSKFFISQVGELVDSDGPSHFPFLELFVVGFKFLEFRLEQLESLQVFFIIVVLVERFLEIIKIIQIVLSTIDSISHFVFSPLCLEFGSKSNSGNHE